jgi:DNA-binding HxlR family transcriptional regulator
MNFLGVSHHLQQIRSCILFMWRCDMTLQDYDNRQLECPLERTMRILSGKWKGKILYYLYEDTQRISNLQRLLPEASRFSLTQHLRELEENGIVHREVYPETPPRVEYSLTELGRSLMPILLSLLDWAERHADTLGLELLSSETCYRDFSEMKEKT